MEVTCRITEKSKEQKPVTAQEVFMQDEVTGTEELKFEDRKGGTSSRQELPKEEGTGSQRRNLSNQ